MQIVIDIPEETYKEIKEGFYDKNTRKMAIAIGNGIPLPKGHGRLIDADELKSVRLPTSPTSDGLWITSKNCRSILPLLHLGSMLKPLNLLYFQWFDGDMCRWNYSIHG